MATSHFFFLPLDPKLFGSLWIGGNDDEGHSRKTDLQGKFIILPLDFSMLMLDSDNPKQFVADFNSYIVSQIVERATDYHLTLRSSTSPADALDSLMHAARRLDNTPVYVFFDEYDTPFTKIVLGSTLSEEQKETTLASLRESYSSVLLSIKSIGFCLFMTGIVDISIPSFSWISFSRTTFEPAWHTLSGFTEDDIKSLLQTVCERLPEDDPRRYLLSQEHVVKDPEQQKDDPRQWLNDKRTALERLRDAYNGYWFGRTHDAQPAKMYNADMVLYFVRFVLSRGRFPEKGELIDPDANISDKILKFAGSLPWLGGLLVAPLTEKLITFRSPAATVDMEDIMILFKNPSDPKACHIFWQLLLLRRPHNRESQT